MTMRTRKFALASAITLALASVSGMPLADTMSPEVASARQESQISTTYHLNPYLRTDDIKVSVIDGTATLIGTVEEDVDKELAKQIALSVDGIRKVDNQIEVDPTYAAPPRKSEDRTFGEVVDDATLTATVKSKLLWSKNTEGLEMDVPFGAGRWAVNVVARYVVVAGAIVGNVTATRQLTLRGTAQSDAAKALAGRMAENTRGVTSVDNRLTVNSSKAVSRKDKGAEAGKVAVEAVSDSWITTKVKSTYLSSRSLDSDDIKVDTSKGNVTLTGTVASGEQRDLATELALNIRGVNKVNATALTF